jgi:hypothetical protein
MANHISIDTLSNDKIWPKPGVGKRPHETRQVGPMPHSGTAHLDAASPKVVKMPALVNECQEGDVEMVVTERRDQKSPLPLGATPEVEAGADEKNFRPVAQ